MCYGYGSIWAQRQSCKRWVNQCTSVPDTSNKMAAAILSYFTGVEAQSAETFGFCAPQLTLPDNLDDVVTSREVSSKTRYSIPALASYTGVLPGVSDQPSIVFAFPPPDSAAYTWPQVKCLPFCWVFLLSECFF